MFLKSCLQVCRSPGEPAVGVPGVQHLQSAAEQLCRIRVEESKSLLLNTEYSLADIALAMGFADQSYYCKSFKRIVGIPPGRFRQSV